MTNKLGPGSVFPEMAVNIVGGDPINLPDDLEGKYNVILFYRGHW
jgi:elongation factor P hydroxylase